MNVSLIGLKWSWTSHVEQRQEKTLSPFFLIQLMSDLKHHSRLLMKESRLPNSGVLDLSMAARETASDQLWCW